MRKCEWVLGWLGAFELHIVLRKYLHESDVSLS